MGAFAAGGFEGKTLDDMQILLTGGSGTVGREVLKLLSQQSNIHLTAFDIKTRKTQKAYKPYLDKVSVVYGDLSKQEEVEAVCKGMDCVIHLAAIIPPLADEKPDLAYQVNVVGTQNLLNALAAHSPDAFFLYASSVAIYGDRLAQPMIYKSDPLLPSEGDEYAKTKIQAEQWVTASQLDWSIFRLSAIMGIGNHKVSGLMFHMPLDSPMEIASPADTARAFVHAIPKRELLSKQIFNLGGGEKCRIIYHDFLSRNFELFGLGAADFPAHAFAEKNFHCGYFADGDQLEEIVSFRKDTMESYFKQIKASISPLRRFMTSLFKSFIKKYLLKQSEPYKAYQENDRELKARFFV